MPDREKVIKAIYICLGHGHCNDCEYHSAGHYTAQNCRKQMMTDVFAMLKEQEKEIKALRLLVEWAEECDFGFDQFHDEYEQYKDEIEDMKYIDGMIHVAKRTLEDHGALWD